LAAAEAHAQNGHVAGGAGLSAGTGGSAPALDISAGYQPSAHIGFELALSVIPQLDFGTEDFGLAAARAQGFGGPGLLPRMTLSSTGRLTAVQVNVIVPVTSAGRFRLSAIAGGGTPSLRVRVHAHRDAYTVPVISVPGFDIKEFTLPAVDMTRSMTDTGLALNAGGLAEYALTPDVGLGVNLRYLHASASRDIDVFRAAGQLTWRF
jgi:hypothetical protein